MRCILLTASAVHKTPAMPDSMNKQWHNDSNLWFSIHAHVIQARIKRESCTSRAAARTDPQPRLPRWLNPPRRAPRYQSPPPPPPAPPPPPRAATPLRAAPACAAAYRAARTAYLLCFFRGPCALPAAPSSRRRDAGARLARRLQVDGAGRRGGAAPRPRRRGVAGGRQARV